MDIRPAIITVSVCSVLAFISLISVSFFRMSSSLASDVSFCASHFFLLSLSLSPLSSLPQVISYRLLIIVMVIGGWLVH